MSPELSLVIALSSLLVATYSTYLSSRKNSTQELYRRIKEETDLESRLSKLEYDLPRAILVHDKLVALETQMAPLWRVVEDSVLRGLIHNPLTVDERAALNIYWRRKEDPRWLDKAALLKGKKGLQRELKALEDNPQVATESTLPYVLVIAAIDRRLAGGGYYS